MNHTIRRMFIVVIFALAGAAQAAKPIYSGGRERAAIRGYDPVAYFTEKSPVKGLREFTLEHQGAKWMFSTQSNMTLFKQNPDKYIPQYGGYCAYAIAQNTTASVKPQYFSVYEGKLYLNYSKAVFKRWVANKDKFIKQAEANWPTVLEK